MNFFLFVFFFDHFNNLIIHSCDGEAEFSAAIIPAFILICWFGAQEKKSYYYHCWNNLIIS